jgi:hypothetical protein
LPQGFSEARRGKFGFRKKLGVKSRRGSAPAGAAASIVIGVWGHQPPSVIPEEAHFHGKS